MAHNIQQIESIIENAERVVRELRTMVAQTTGDAKEWLDERMRATDRHLAELRREMTQLVNRLQAATIRDALRKTHDPERARPRQPESGAVAVNNETDIREQRTPTEAPCAVLSTAAEPLRTRAAAMRS